jgi:eukaryotic-like serine/threonine-protein kinase
MSVLSHRPATSRGSSVNVYRKGDVIEGYRVEAELGRGAESIIYVVQDPSSKEIWALKHVIKETEKDERFLEQTEAEYDIGSRMKHTTIRGMHRLIKKRVSMFGAVNEMFLLMELVDGVSLEKQPPTTLEGASGIFEQVAKALAYMHERGYVHADMKPNNIVVDGDGQAKVIDLGQSCAVNTVKKRIQGTPDYIAPEQVHRRPITGKTDVYNLGATMYWCLTRQYVPTALAKSDSLVGSVDDSLMPKPKRPMEINNRVPEIFDKLIMDCVEVEPALRPEMAEVSDRLNLIRGKLLAESELRKSGGYRRISAE